MQTLERCPNPLTRAVDNMGNFLLKNIDRIPMRGGSSGQTKIEFPRISRENIWLAVGVIGIISAAAGYLDSASMVTQIQGGQNSEQYRQFVQSPRNGLDQLLAVGGVIALMGGALGKATRGFEEPIYY